MTSPWWSSEHQSCLPHQIYPPSTLCRHSCFMYRCLTINTMISSYSILSKCTPKKSSRLAKLVCAFSGNLNRCGILIIMLKIHRVTRLFAWQFAAAGARGPTPRVSCTVSRETWRYTPSPEHARRRYMLVLTQCIWVLLDMSVRIAVAIWGWTLTTRVVEHCYVVIFV